MNDKDFLEEKMEDDKIQNSDIDKKKKKTNQNTKKYVTYAEDQKARQAPWYPCQEA